MSDLVGRMLGKYLLLERIGRGGMGEVYRALHPTLVRPVAIKVLRSDRAGNEDAINRFKDEAKAVALLRHPNIVQVHDFDVAGDLHYMVMEWVNGTTLEQRLDQQPAGAKEAQAAQEVWRGRLRQILDKRFDEGELRDACFDLDITYDDLPGRGQGDKARELVDYLDRRHKVSLLIRWGKTNRTDIDWDAVFGDTVELPAVSPAPFSLREIGRIITDLASAIDFLHREQVVHCDLKPANILFKEPGDHVMLADFGIARILSDPDQSYVDAVAGTPAYMSPEQLLGRPLEAASDIYSLGVILYEMVVGQLPFPADHPADYILHHMQTPPRSPRSLKADVLPAVESVILKALSKKAADRYTSAGDLAFALRKAISPLPTAPLIAAPAPFQPPPELPHFVGRERAIEEYAATLTSGGKQNLFCLTGMGGIGKTTLAIHLAHRLRQHFSDGVLWAELNADSTPLAVLDSWARAFDLDLSHLPDLSSRAAALRGKLAGRKILLVLDDVWQVEKARPLLLIGPPAAVLLTTRSTKVARALDGRTLQVTVLEPAESRQLLAHNISEERIAMETEAADEIGRLLGYLPLAVKIAAQLALLPRWRRLANLAQRLRDEKSRLDLALEDREVRASVTTSWDTLPAALQRAFALLAVFGSRPFTTDAFIAISQLEAGEAADTLYSLVVLSLLEEEGERHYRQHPLLADYAHEQLGQQSRAAFERMARYYLEYARQNQKDFLALEGEWDNLLAGMRAAHQGEQWPLVMAYADHLMDTWFARGYFSDARQGYEWAVQAAEEVADWSKIPFYLRRWGQACIEQGDYPEATRHLERSLALYRGMGEQVGVAAVLNGLGRIAVEESRFDDAKLLLDESYQLHHQLGSGPEMSKTMGMLAAIDYAAGLFEPAERTAQQALIRLQAADDKASMVEILRLLTNITLHGRQDMQMAEAYCQQAITLAQMSGNQSELASMLSVLSKISRMQGNLAAAHQQAEQSVTVLRDIGDRKSLAMALYRQSLIESDLAAYPEALRTALQSLELCRVIPDEWGMVYVLQQVAKLYKLDDQLREAQQIRQEALNIAERLQHPSLPALQSV
jgi:serine/threonine protein kinase/tetratricopeptide (TPR) repeat protein